jgi:uncharacterized membrane protein
MENSNENPKPMKKIIIYTVIGLIIIFGVIFFIMNKGGTPTTATSPDSIRSILSSGASKQCTINQTTDTTKVTGSVYIANGKMRADITSASTGVTTNAHMVISNDYTYTWVDGVSTGFKVAMSQSTTDTSRQPLDLDDQKGVVCTSWSANDAKFDLPTNISFPDLPTSTTK